MDDVHRWTREDSHRDCKDKSSMWDETQASRGIKEIPQVPLLDSSGNDTEIVPTGRGAVILREDNVTLDILDTERTRHLSLSTKERY